MCLSAVIRLLGKVGTHQYEREVHVCKSTCKDMRAIATSEQTKPVCGLGMLLATCTVLSVSS